MANTAKPTRYADAWRAGYQFAIRTGTHKPTPAPTGRHTCPRIGAPDEWVGLDNGATLPTADWNTTPGGRA